MKILKKLEWNLLWSKNTGGISYDGNALSIDANNDIIITGKSIDVSLFDTNAFINTLDSALYTSPEGPYWKYFHPNTDFVSKYAPDGSILWIKEIGGNPQEIISDYNNNIIITGNFLGR